MKAAAAPAAEPATVPVTLNKASRQSRRQAGETAPDHLLRSPKSVDSTADQFFNGLRQQVEGDR